MLTYLSYLLVPKEEETPTIHLVSRDGECLAFRCSATLAQGRQRVVCRMARGHLSFEVDVYRLDAETGLYEGRMLERTVRPHNSEGPKQPSGNSLYGHIKERFASGVTVRVDKPLTVGAYLKVEVEDAQSVSEVHLANVLWARDIPGEGYDVRLNFLEKEKLATLPRDQFVAV